MLSSALLPFTAPIRITVVPESDILIVGHTNRSRVTYLLTYLLTFIQGRM